MSRAARWLTFGSATSIMLSITASQVLLALALAALLLSGEKLRLPPIKLPLAIFVLLTLAAWVFSPDPWSDGFPQIRKFYVFCSLLVVFSTFRDMAIVRWLILTWAGIGGLSALRGFVQFAAKIKEAHQAGADFYNYYVTERITGFSSHWNTYAAEEMFALVMLAALLFFGIAMRKRWIWILCATLIAVALYLGETRAVWIATAAASLYLVWFWKRRLVLFAPLVAVIAFAVSPPAMRERFTSMLQPTRVDSNEFRLIAWNAGIQMIERHPLFGLGPDGPKYHFEEYVPAGTWSSKPPGFYEHLHNIYLQYGAERGIPALLVFLWLMIRIVVDFWRGVCALPPGRSDRRYLLHGGIAMVLAIMAEGVAEVNLGTSVVLTMFLVVVACGYLALEKSPAL
jgi:putative inorganic carbon (HCO3(-)) transporter